MGYFGGRAEKELAGVRISNTCFFGLENRTYKQINSFLVRLRLIYSVERKVSATEAENGLFGFAEFCCVLFMARQVLFSTSSNQIDV